MLEGLIDIYLPDFKYYSDNNALRYSGVYNYSETVKEALKEMRRQVKDTFDENNIMKSGLIIRHFPEYKAKTKEYSEIGRKITKEELREVEDFLFEQNMLNGYIQELGQHEEEYVPDFNLENV